MGIRESGSEIEPFNVPDGTGYRGIGAGILIIIYYHKKGIPYTSLFPAIKGTVSKILVKSGFRIKNF